MSLGTYSLGEDMVGGELYYYVDTGDYYKLSEIHTVLNYTPLLENVNLISNLTSIPLYTVLESILVASSAPTSFTMIEIITNILTIVDDSGLIFKDDMNEVLGSTDLLLNHKTQVIDAFSIILANSAVNTVVNFSNFILALISILDASIKELGESVLDLVSVNSQIDMLYLLYASVIESTEITPTSSASSIIIFPLSDNVITDNSLTSSSVFSSLLSDELLITLKKDLISNTYLAYLLSPETNSVSTYNNYNFNGCTKFGYKYLFYNRTGLYEHGGNTDNGDPIRSEMETVAFNFKTSNLKQVPSIYLGVDSSDKVILKVRVDGKAEVHYQLNKFTNNLMTQKIDIGKGLIGRYFQFELLTEASEFNMESIEFYPLEIRRKL